MGRGHPHLDCPAPPGQRVGSSKVVLILCTAVLFQDHAGPLGGCRRVLVCTAGPASSCVPSVPILPSSDSTAERGNDCTVQSNWLDFSEHHWAYSPQTQVTTPSPNSAYPPEDMADVSGDLQAAYFKNPLKSSLGITKRRLETFQK